MRILAWDSEFFGKRIARVDVIDRDWRRVAESERIDCVYHLIPADDHGAIARAEAARFSLVDIRVTLQRAVDTATTPLSPRIRRATPADIPRLEQIAAVSHRDTRFYVDPHFERSRVDELYRTWIRQGVLEPSNVAWVLDEGAGAKGYATCSRDGRIGLVAVSPDSRGRGGSRDLVEAVRRQPPGGQPETITVVTQGRNVGAQKLYQRSGFVTVRTELWYHRWLGDSD